MADRRVLKPEEIVESLRSIPDDRSECDEEEQEGEGEDTDSEAECIPESDSSGSESDSETDKQEGVASSSTHFPRRGGTVHGGRSRGQRPQTKANTTNMCPQDGGGAGDGLQLSEQSKSKLVSSDGTEWIITGTGERLQERRANQNVLREAPGPTGHARRHILSSSSLSAWRLFIDDFILMHIKKCTVAETYRQEDEGFSLDTEELEAFIAIFYARGVSGTSDHYIGDIWSKYWGVPFCKETMSRDRSEKIKRYFRFDEKSTRSERLKTDKFALFSTVSQRFIDNSIACYRPGPVITVDKQLFPSKARCPFVQFMPANPDKYGHKYWLGVDKDSKYVVNGFPYLGKDDERPENERLSDYVAMEIMSPYLKKGRNVTTDSYFTSKTLANQLKAQGTSLVGTLKKIRREVPVELRKMKNPLYFSQIYKSEGMTPTVYQGKTKKNVLILSTLHPDIQIDSQSPNKTPETVKFYNETKFAVDVVGKMAHKYSTRTCTRRWPIHCFQNTLDLAGVNAWVVYKEATSSKISRKKFLQKLVTEIADPYVRSRKKRGFGEVDSSSDSEETNLIIKSKLIAKRTEQLESSACARNLCADNVEL